MEISVYDMSPEIPVYTLKSGNFCIRCVSGDVLDTCGRSYPDILVYDDVTVSIQSYPSENFSKGCELVCCLFVDFALESSQAQLIGLSFQISGYVAGTCGRSYAIRIRYVWTRVG